jgi:hypothetical protein
VHCPRETLTEAPLSWNPPHTNPPGGLANYYRNNVIGGPGAFVMVAENSNSFRDIIVKKLIAEIAQAVPQQRAEKVPYTISDVFGQSLRARARVNVNLELSRSGNGVRNGFRRLDGRGSGVQYPRRNRRSGQMRATS